MRPARQGSRRIPHAAYGYRPRGALTASSADGKAVVVEVSGRWAQPQLPFNNCAAEAEIFMGTCPDCSSQLESAEGCNRCHVCGYS
jgi:ribonucleoside-diphosphate reductase alpha chain